MDSSGVIVTNLHVLRGESVASIKLANGDIYDDIAVVDVDERKDLLLVKIKAFGPTPAVLGNSDDIGVGDRIIVLGSPQGLETGDAGVCGEDEALASAVKDLFRFRNRVAHGGVEPTREDAERDLVLVRDTIETLDRASTRLRDDDR